MSGMEGIDMFKPSSINAASLIWAGEENLLAKAFENAARSDCVVRRRRFAMLECDLDDDVLRCLEHLRYGSVTDNRTMPKRGK